MENELLRSPKLLAIVGQTRRFPNVLIQDGKVRVWDHSNMLLAHEPIGYDPLIGLTALSILHTLKPSAPELISGPERGIIILDDVARAYREGCDYTQMLTSSRPIPTEEWKPRKERRAEKREAGKGKSKKGFLIRKKTK